MTRPRKNPGASGIRTRDLPLSRRTPYHLANEAVQEQQPQNQYIYITQTQDRTGSNFCGYFYSRAQGQKHKSSCQLLNIWQTCGHQQQAVKAIDWHALLWQNPSKEVKTNTHLQTPFVRLQQNNHIRTNDKKKKEKKKVVMFFYLWTNVSPC